MTNVPLKEVSNILTSVGTLNENFERIEKGFEKTLSRTGESPNQMESLLDMNRYPIINLPMAYKAGMPVTYDQINPDAEQVIVAPVRADEIIDDVDELKLITEKLRVADGAKLQDAIAVAENPIQLLASLDSYETDSILRTADGYLYQVADPSVTDAHLVTAGGTKLYVVPEDGVVNVMAFGAHPANSASVNTVAIQRALDTGLSIELPRLLPGEVFNVNGILDLKARGQCVYGKGLRSMIVQNGTGSASTVFRALNLGQNEFHSVFAIPNSVVGGTLEGYGIAIVNSSFSLVHNCRVSNHRRGGILLYDSNYCRIANNWIVDSVVDSSVDTQSTSGCDVYISGNSSFNHISGNFCINGSGIGVAIQSLSPGTISRFNKIEGNTIQNQDMYGIMLYKMNASDSLTYNQILDNTIDTVTGNIPEDGGAYAYGAGIYIQTADETTIEGNTVRNTNVRPSPSLLHSPAAIGITGVTNCIVKGNIIQDANYWGIAVIQATVDPDPIGRGVEVIGNKLYGCKVRGIFLQDNLNGIVTGNRVHGSGTQGIYLRQISLTQSNDFTIADNQVIGFATGIINEGIVQTLLAHDNIVRGNTGYGIFLNAVINQCHHNTVYNGSGGFGIGIGSNCLDGFCENNVVLGGTYGFIDGSNGNLRVQDNITRNTSTTFDGGAFRILDNSATPSVRNARWVSNNNTTTITNFADGFDGQVITLRALSSFTVQSGIGIDLAGGTNFAMTAEDTLTLVKVGSAWRELSRAVL